MAIIDLNDRIGPNQDINDPTNITTLSSEFVISSNKFIDIAFAKPRLPFGPSIATPIKFVDGSETSFVFSSSGVSDADFENIWSSGVINTYINLPELYRQYWNTMNNILLQIGSLNGSGIFSEENESSQQSFTEEDGNDVNSEIRVLTISYENEIEYFEHIFVTDPNNGYIEPIWSGNGPTNYNFGTFPQLINEVKKLRPEIVTNEPEIPKGTTIPILEKFYLYGKRKGTVEIFGQPSPLPIDNPEILISLAFDRSRLDIVTELHSPIPSIIINPSGDPLTVNYSMTGTSSASVSVASPFSLTDRSVFSIVSFAITVRATGIGSIEPISSWPIIHSDSGGDSDSSVINTGASVSASFLNSDSFDIPSESKAAIIFTAGVEADVTAYLLREQFVVGTGFVPVVTDYSMSTSVNLSINTGKSYSLNQVLAISD